MIHAVESEVALIGAAMLDKEQASDAVERIKPDLFSEPTFARIWAFIQAQPGKVDPFLVSQAFADDAAVKELGGQTFLMEAYDRANFFSLPAHIDAVVDAATRREVSGLAREYQGLCEKEAGQGEALLADLERGLSEIARRHVSRPQAIPAGIGALEMLEAAYSGEFVGTPVGLDAIDRVTGGIRQDDVWFIGGRTSMGKSVMGLCLARGLAEQGRGVFMFSLEMPMREVQARLIADIAYDRSIPENTYDGGNVRYGDILKGRGTQFQKDRARKAARQLASLPLVVNDRAGHTIEEIRAQALRQVRAWEKAGVEPGAILIDHIGLVRAHTKRGDSKAAETADIVNELKGLAKQVGAPVIALCQVSRNTENRNDKRPTLADLNWSGAIEQIADFVCLLYREAYYLERSNDDDALLQAARARHDLELLIQKNRSGPICNVKSYVDIGCNAIRDIESHYDRRMA